MTVSVNALWQGYLKVVGWVEAAGKWVADNSHKTTWMLIVCGVGYLISLVL